MQNSRDGFWKKIPLSVPKPTKDFRIFNPEILQDTASMMGYQLNDGKANKVIDGSQKAGEEREEGRGGRGEEQKSFFLSL